MDRYSTGSSFVKGNVIDTFINQELIKEIDNKEDRKENIKNIESVDVKKVSLKEIDERLMTIDDFIDIDK